MTHATYAVDADIKLIFGVANVDVWSDLDNDEDATKMAAALDGARWHAYNEINDRLRATHYRIPIAAADGSIPHEVTHLEARLAGILLALPRGMEDVGPGVTSMRTWREECEQDFQKIISGEKRLAAL